MHSSAPVFLTNRSDYHHLVLFRHIRQQLAAMQTGAVKIFCADAASKPENEFHYLGLLWNCAFQAGIASMGAHSEPAPPPSITAAPISAHSEPTSLPPVAGAISTSPTSSKILPTPIRDFSALRPSTRKPFGSLHRRFRRRLQIPAPVQILLLQTEKVPPSLDPFVSPLAPVSPQSSHSAPVLPQPPYLSHIPPPQPLRTRAYLSQLPAAIPISHFLPDEPPSNVYPSNVNVLGLSMRRSSWFRLKPKLSHWIQLPSASHRRGGFPTSISGG
jgi:hypothetical protein